MKTHGCLFIGLVGALLTFAPVRGQDAPSDPIGERMEEAFDLYMAGEHARAEALYRALLKVDPTNLDAQYELGLVLRAQGKRDAAVTIFKRILEQDEDHADAWAELGDILVEQGKMKQAVPILRQAVLRADPKDAFVRGLLGAALVADGKAAEGEAYLQEAVEAEPGEPWLLVELGRARLELGKDAVEILRRAWETDPTSEEAWSLYARAAQSAGEEDRLLFEAERAHAEEDFDGAATRVALLLEKVPANARGLVVRGHVALHRENPDAAAAARDYSQALLTVSEDRPFPPAFRAHILEGLAIAQSLQAQWAEAIGTMTRVVQMDETAAWPRYLLATFEAGAGRKTDALRSLRTALAADRDLAEEAAADPDFASLRGDPSFRDLLAEFGVELEDV